MWCVHACVLWLPTGKKFERFFSQDPESQNTRVRTLQTQQRCGNKTRTDEIIFEDDPFSNKTPDFSCDTYYTVSIYV